MARTKQNSKAAALARLLERIDEQDDLCGLCREAGQLAEEVNQTDVATAEKMLIDNGYSLQMARHLSNQFMFMGMYEQKSAHQHNLLQDDHILRRISVEHDLFRCHAAELNALTKTITHLNHLSDVSAEFRTLIRVVRYLDMLREHMDREEDIIFPYLRVRGYAGLCLTAEKQHVRLRAYVDNLMGLVLSFSRISLEEFKVRLVAIVQLFYPLLLDHLAFEEGLIHPIALVAIDNPETWESIKTLCDQMGYCELPS